MELVRNLAECSYNFWMAVMPDQYQFIIVFIVTIHFIVHLDHEWASRIDDFSNSVFLLLPRPFWQPRGH